MTARIFLNLGRSFSGILADALKAFGHEAKLVVVAQLGDKLLAETPLPEGAEVVLVAEDGRPVLRRPEESAVRFMPAPLPDVTEADVFVLNGGTTSQTVAMLVWLSRGGNSGQLVNLQRDRAIEMASSPLRNLAEDKLDHEAFWAAYYGATEQSFSPEDPLYQFLGINADKVVKAAYGRVQSKNWTVEAATPAELRREWADAVELYWEGTAAAGTSHLDEEFAREGEHKRNESYDRLVELKREFRKRGIPVPKSPWALPD